MISISSRCAGRPGLGQRRRDVFDQRLAFELHGRKIDRHLDVGLPERRVRACRPQHPRADHGNQADLLSDRNEVDRRYHPLRRMVPAQQRFEALYAILVED